MQEVSTFWKSIGIGNERSLTIENKRITTRHSQTNIKLLYMDGKRLLQIVTETRLTQSKCVLERQRKDLEGIDFSWYKIVLVNRVCVAPCKIYFPNIIDSLMPVRPCLVSLDIYLIVRMKRGSASRSALKPFSAIFGSKGVVGKDSLPVPHFQKLVCLLLTAKEGKYRKAHHKRRKKIWWHKLVIQVLYHVMIWRGTIGWQSGISWSV